MADDLQTGVCSTNWLTRSSCGLSETLVMPYSGMASGSHEIVASGFRWSAVHQSLATEGKSGEEMEDDNHSVSISSNICGSVNTHEVRKPAGTVLMGSPLKLTDGCLSSLATRQWSTGGFIGCGRSDGSGLQVRLQSENYLNSQQPFRQDPPINSVHYREEWTATQDSNTNAHEAHLFGFEDRSNTAAEYYSITGDRSFAENIAFDRSYGYPPSSMLHAAGPIDQEENPLLNISSLNYTLNSQTLFPDDFGTSWPVKPFPSLSSTSVPPPRQQPNGNFQFLNDSPLWSSSIKGVNNVRASLYDEKHRSIDPNSKAHSEEIISSDTTKGSKETTLKRPRIETPSILPTFKVRKEKLSDRVTALQQLVSPFGKTDTASVLQEAIQYIKFLHEQVNVLSNPYMKSGVQAHQRLQNSSKRNDQEITKQDLRSRGLCLVPISSTFAVSTEMPPDFWRPSLIGSRNCG